MVTRWFNSRAFIRAVAILSLVALATTCMVASGCASWGKHDNDGPKTVEDVLSAKRPG